jgi:MoaA/NifB/PqqE/SkfB family radical SAM enzyme
VLNALRILREPVPNEKKRLMRARWDALDPRWRTIGQGLGQQATGCGATIGVHPRCDFACAACYLGVDANTVRPLDVGETFRQLDHLRTWLGPKGNVQITDGEVTLLPVQDLVAIIRYARRIGLIPMVMTHGDTFRRRPGLLELLMREGGLTEVSIHVDTTQRGRLGYKHADSEVALQPLREEFAEMIRTARRATRHSLRAAMTLTVTRDNLGDVAHVVEWCLLNRDAFGLLSFQPVAPVGRSQADLDRVTAPDLWNQIDSALAPYGLHRRSGTLSFGHPDCTRLELVIVYQRKGRVPQIVPIVRSDDERDAQMLDAFMRHGLGGINFRDDTLLERVCRTVGALVLAPRWVAGPLRRWALERLNELDTNARRLTWDVIRGKVHFSGFTIASHHFMSLAELETPTGRERLAACVFRVPINGTMMPMCRVNATGLREALYRAGSESIVLLSVLRERSA